MAVAIMAVLTGTSLPIEPYPGLADIAASFDLSTVSLGPARFDPAELDSLNARILHAMPYEVAVPRLDQLGLASEPLWLALRGNLARFADIADLATMVKGPVTPVVADEDRDYLAVARELLPDEPYDETTWSAWTTVLKERTGRKGRGLFHPLRLALTGREQGPELRALLPLLGRKACLDRLP
jgi:glutamyl-tRNA synthetase